MSRSLSPSRCPSRFPSPPSRFTRALLCVIAGFGAGCQAWAQTPNCVTYSVYLLSDGPSVAATLSPAEYAANASAIDASMPVVKDINPACAPLNVEAPLAGQGMRQMRESLRLTMQHVDALRDPHNKVPAGHLTLYALGAGVSRQESGAGTATQSLSRTDFTLGTDYRYNSQWVTGASLGFGRPHLHWSDSSTKVDGSSGVATVYGSWSPSPQSYVAAAVSAEGTRYALFASDSRGNTTTGHANGANVGLSLSAGYDVPIGRATLSPFVRFDQVYSWVSDFGVNASNNLGRSGSVNLGAQLQTSLPTPWGVVVPHVRLEFTHIVGWQVRGASAQLYASGGNVLLAPSPLALDAQYGQVGFGLMALLPHGLSVFSDVDAGFAQKNVKSRRLTLGLRGEL